MACHLGAEGPVDTMMHLCSTVLDKIFPLMDEGEKLDILRLRCFRTCPDLEALMDVDDVLDVLSADDKKSGARKGEGDQERT